VRLVTRSLVIITAAATSTDGMKPSRGARLMFSQPSEVIKLPNVAKSPCMEEFLTCTMHQHHAPCTNTMHHALCTMHQHHAPYTMRPAPCTNTHVHALIYAFMHACTQICMCTCPSLLKHHCMEFVNHGCAQRVVARELLSFRGSL